MEKLLLISVLVMMIVVPLRAARIKDANKSLRSAATRFLFFSLLYWGVVLVGWYGLFHGADASSLLPPVKH